MNIQVLILALSFYTITPAHGSLHLAAVPVTQLLNQGLHDIFARQTTEYSCPEATQTLCADGHGCCPSGIACTTSSGIPVCDEICDGTVICADGGCCQLGYTCDLYTSTLCIQETGDGVSLTYVYTAEPTTAFKSSSAASSVPFPSNTVTLESVSYYLSDNPETYASTEVSSTKVPSTEISSQEVSQTESVVPASSSTNTQSAGSHLPALSGFFICWIPLIMVILAV
ncbi:hypothetical protein ASPZODRAFT_127771 [Penicilliopsis zonata CBS 506.65]|uniref:Uncharacterized protein n=1 Tax=Penicilliopsis zonata CBS 506.65 TaxID=1073090 RepID=A0A1L9SWV4_9EURO|nr:hypothetical protein ASPZODRAFT_127771 [Penicilliopsis zonata CBS 506.65]OJJ51654.1 hypothetical protein ASPZODRAFT_127771 [Penicilliopsis zonata CBS 506.65]